MQPLSTGIRGWVGSLSAGGCSNWAITCFSTWL